MAALVAAHDDSISLGSLQEFYEDLPCQYSPADSSRASLASNACNVVPAALSRNDSTLSVCTKKSGNHQTKTQLFLASLPKTPDLLKRSCSTSTGNTTAAMTMDYSAQDGTSASSSSSREIVLTPMDDVTPAAVAPRVDVLTDEQTVRVAVRLYPATDSAWEYKPRDSDSENDDDALSMNLLSPPFSTYPVDTVLDANATTQSVYEQVVHPLVLQVLSGKHATLLCRGDTSVTMHGSPSEAGLIARAVTALLAASPDVQLSCQYFDIYQDQARDLLTDPPLGSFVPGNQSSALQRPVLRLTEEQDAIAVNVNAATTRIETLVDVARVLQHTADRQAHVVLQLHVQKPTDQPHTSTLATLSFVELAAAHGHKRNGKTDPSLAELSRTIGVLAREDYTGLGNDTPPTAVPVWRSTLTRVLKPSLLGHACLRVLCSVSTGKSHVDETRAVLHFARKARRLSMQAKVNTVTDAGAMIADLRSELVRIKASLQDAQARIETEKLVEAIADNGYDDDSMSPRAQSHNDAASEVGVGFVSPLAAAKIFRSMVDKPGSGTDADNTSDRLDREETSISTDVSSKAVVGVDSGNIVQFEAPLLPSLSGPPVTEIAFEALPSAEILGNDEADETCPDDALDATGQNSADQLISKLFQDLKRAARCNGELQDSNDILQRRLDNVGGSGQHDPEEAALLQQQHVMLKYAVYAGLACYVCGLTDLFLATVLFLWLMLEMWA